MRQEDTIKNDTQPSTDERAISPLSALLDSIPGRHRQTAEPDEDEDFPPDEFGEPVGVQYFTEAF